MFNESDTDNFLKIKKLEKVEIAAYISSLPCGFTRYP